MNRTEFPLRRVVSITNVKCTGNIGSRDMHGDGGEALRSPVMPAASAPRLSPFSKPSPVSLGHQCRRLCVVLDKSQVLAFACSRPTLEPRRPATQPPSVPPHAGHSRFLSRSLSFQVSSTRADNACAEVCSVVASSEVPSEVPRGILGLSHMG